MSTLKKASNLIWIDLEMTGLDASRDCILEIATVITDKNLNLLSEGPVFAIHQSEKILSRMDSWNVKHHTQSGLIQRVKNSRIKTKEAELLTLEFIKQYVPAKKSPICGNTIYQDRIFLKRYMPTLESYFHYRQIDVSTLKELIKRWSPKKLFKKKSKHIALSDIHDSINELKYYRDNFLTLF